MAHPGTLLKPGEAHAPDMVRMHFWLGIVHALELDFLGFCVQPHLHLGRMRQGCTAGHPVVVVRDVLRAPTP